MSFSGMACSFKSLSGLCPALEVPGEVILQGAQTRQRHQEQLVKLAAVVGLEPDDAMTTAFCLRDALERASHRGGRDGDLEVNRGLERPRLELFARATLDRSLRRVPDHRV